MKQTGVTEAALFEVKKGYQAILDEKLIRPKKAFVSKLGDISDIKISGRTLRKIFTGDQVAIDTITDSLEQFKKEWFLNNGEIDIKNEV